MDQIKAMRIKMKELAEEGKMKEELYRRLVILSITYAFILQFISYCYSTHDQSFSHC